MSEPYLLSVPALLWPDDPAPEVHKGRTPPDGRVVFRAVPRARDPRLLVPVGAAAGAAAVRAYGDRGTRANRRRTAAVAAVLALGLGNLVFPERVRAGRSDQGISAELARVLGGPVQLAVRGGPRRANRKPVLAVLDAHGTVAGYAKIGPDELTASLVRAEADALERLGACRHGLVRAPRLLHSGTWRDMPLLVQEALPVTRARAVGADALATAMREVAELGGTSRGPWAGSGHARQVRERLQRSPRSTAATVLGRAVEALTHDDVALPLGTWHGDWTPWNCAAADGAVALWDWERFATGVPLGMDVLHHELQISLARPGAISADLPRSLLAGAPDRLRGWGLSDHQARTTAVAYLVEICSRYLADDQAAAGARVGALDSWLLPALGEAAERMSCEPEESKR